MAINQIIIKRLKYVLCIALIFFLVQCVSATDNGDGTGQFEISSSSEDEYDIAAQPSSAATVQYIARLYVNDVGVAAGVESIICNIPADQWGGGSANSDWGAVNYRIDTVGGTIVATGSFGYNKGSTQYYVGAFFDEGTDLSNGGAYSGGHWIFITGTVPNVRADGPPGSTPFESFSSVDQTTKTLAYMAFEDTRILATHTSGTVTHQTTLGYDFKNTYTYSQSYNSLDFTLDKSATNQSNVTITNNGGKGVFLDGGVNSVDIDVHDSDITNTTWTVGLINAHGDPFSDTINMAYTPPQTEDTIEWGDSSYVVDDTGSYSWSLSDDNWDTWLYSKKASIYRDETMVHEVSLPTQTGTFYYTFEEEGSFTVKLRHTSALLPHVTIDTDTVNVIPIGDSYIHVNNTIVVGQHFDINFSYGFTPGNYLVNGVRAKYFHEDSNEWLLEKQWTVSDLYPITANTIYQVSGTHKVSFEGDYIFELFDFSKGVVATTPIITSILSSSTPPLNISNSYINISKTDYVMGEIMDGFYGIDNTNYTYNNYLVIYNYQYDTTSMDFPLSEQASGFYGTLVQTDIHGDWIAGGEIPVIPGNNKISLYAENSTTSFEIVYVNFTVSAYDEDGYGLQLSTYDACINEEVLISVISPTDANLTIFSPTGMPIKTYTLNGSTTIKYWFPISGMYSLELYKSGEGISRATVTIYISDCADDGIIIIDDGDIDDMYLNMFNFMTLPIFWGMIIFVGFIGGLSMKTNRNGDHLVSGNGLAFIAFGLLNLLAFIGMLAPYTMYAIVSTWIFAGIFFGVGRYLARGE